MKERYTRYPRPILWLLRGGSLIVGDEIAGYGPAFEATVAPFYIGKTPVSQEQYSAYDPTYARPAGSPEDRAPAVGVSFRDAQGYCDWYSRVSRKPIRLPTEVEWEFACRAGTTTRCFWGDDLARAEAHVWDARNSGGRARAQEAKSPNPWGLCGMLGGVWEWTASLNRAYPVVAGDGRDDPGAAGPRVLRGGSFRVDREQLGSAVRRGEDPDARREDVGFRVVRSFG